MKYVLTIEVADDLEREGIHALANQVQQDLSKTDEWWDAKVVGQAVDPT